MAVKVVKMNNKPPTSGGSSTEGQRTRPTSSRLTKPCRYCGYRHEFKKEACPAFDKEYRRCGRKGHFSKVCRSTTKVHCLEDNCSDEEEVCFISSVKMTATHPVLATCTVNQKHQVAFELDTGASCNMLPYEDYVKATGDKLGHSIRKTKTHLTMHNNTSERPVGKVILTVRRSSHSHQLYILQSRVIGKGCPHRNATD